MGETVRFSLHLCCQEMQSELEEWLADKRIETFSKEKTWERNLVRCPNFSFISHELHVKASILLDVPKIEDGLLPCPSSPKKIKLVFVLSYIFTDFTLSLSSPQMLYSIIFISLKQNSHQCIFTKAPV